ncbi:MAG: O-antigen ligase family protein [Verrucomicrobiota bacterium]|nr:O-antigen ligase family protein [Verrucomicrobiota bacterium]
MSQPPKILFKRYFKEFLKAYFLILIFLLPFKFGNVITPVEVGVFPCNLLEWIYASWHPIVLPLLVGIGCIPVVLFFPFHLKTSLKKYFLFPFLWLFLSLSSFIGLLNTTEYDFAYVYILNFMGIFIFSGTICLLALNDTSFRKVLIIVLVTGVLFESIAGWNQFAGGGFEENREFALEQAKKHGIEINPNLLHRLNQNRAYGHFTYPNSFAAYLLLLGPLALFALYRAGRLVEPKKISIPIFLIFGLVLLFGAFILSQSRAAMIALGAGLFLTFFILPIKQKWKISGGITALILALFLFFTVNSGRDLLSSFHARMEYYRVGTNLFLDKPVAGYGLGEFYTNYMRLKTPGAEETRIPHNFLLNLASQTGFLGLIAATLCLLSPLILYDFLRQQKTSQKYLYPTILGMLCWGIHSLADFNIMIPAGTFIYAILPFTVLFSSKSTESEAKSDKKVFCLFGYGMFFSFFQVFLIIFSILAIVMATLRIPGEKAYAELYNYVKYSEQPVLYQIKKKAKMAEKLLPLSPYPSGILGKIALQSKNYLLAERCFERTISKTPHRSAYYLYLSEAQLHQGKTKKAVENILQSKYWYPGNPHLNNNKLLQ